MSKELTSAPKELIGVQYLRGGAAMLVVLHHLYFDGTQLGPFGVKIFFVISGFVMWFTTAAIDISPLVFWRRRLVRIVPLYWLFLSVLVVIGLSVPQYLKSTEITLEAVVKSFIFIPHYHTVQKFIAPILIPGWSLNYEMFFYFIFGIALLARPAALRATLIGMLLCSLVSVGVWFDPRGAVVETYTSPNLLLFLSGIILAMIYRAHNVDNVLLGLILICIGVLIPFVGIPAEFGRFESFIGLAPALIVAGTLALEPAIRRAPSVVLHTLGNASYSIYLSHLFLLRFFELCCRHFATFSTVGVFEAIYVASGFIFALAGGVAVHYVIERPMLLLFVRSRNATKPASMREIPSRG